MKTIIMAGGLGTRIAAVNGGVPKPMLPILGKPVLEYQIETLEKQGFKDVLLVIGHMGEKIRGYFGNGEGKAAAAGKAFGVHIEYLEEKEPLGTAGALSLLKDELMKTEGVDGDFLLVNGDLVFDMDLRRFLRAHKQMGGLATIVTHPNSHPYDSGIIASDEKGRVTKWLHKEDERRWYKNCVNAGIHLISNRIFEEEAGLFENVGKMDLDREVLKPLIGRSGLYIYHTPEYIRDMGVPERFYAVEEDIKAGRMEAKSLMKKQKAAFLDRDGTINKHKGFLRSAEEFELLPGVGEAVRRINESGYLAIVVTNQPVIARGEASEETLREIHNKMETLLGREGAYLDGIYYCPHHPDKGYAGERKELKIECGCRKPKPGMLLQAAADFNIDLKESYLAGDSAADMEAGKRAGCKTARIYREGESREGREAEGYASLLEFVRKNL